MVLLFYSNSVEFELFFLVRAFIRVWRISQAAFIINNYLLCHSPCPLCLLLLLFLMSNTFLANKGLPVREAGNLSLGKVLKFLYLYISIKNILNNLKRYRITLSIKVKTGVPLRIGLQFKGSGLTTLTSGKAYLTPLEGIHRCFPKKIL